MLVIDSIINLLFIYLFSACSSPFLSVLVSLVEITVNLLFTTIGVDAAVPFLVITRCYVFKTTYFLVIMRCYVIKTTYFFIKKTYCFLVIMTYV